LDVKFEDQINPPLTLGTKGDRRPPRRVAGTTSSETGWRNEVEAEMRLAGIAHMADVAWAILETNGKISFIERGEGEPSRQQDEPAVG
jgi:hypothetical protein